MRGKKSETAEELIPENILDYYYGYEESPVEMPEKRKSGFLGMRGKKSGYFPASSYYSPDLDEEVGLYKRAGFLGMRGKKAGQMWYYRPSSW